MFAADFFPPAALIHARSRKQSGLNYNHLFLVSVNSLDKSWCSIIHHHLIQALIIFFFPFEISAAVS